MYEPEFSRQDHLSGDQEVARWFALRVRPRHEKSVFEQLQTKEYEAFLPLYSSRRRWADRWKTVILPLFPGYVFCSFDPLTRVRVLGTPGVIDLVRVGAEPAPVETHEIEAIRRVVHSQLQIEPYPDLVRGQRVMVSGGPLNGLCGVLMEIRNGVRLVLSVELLRRSVQVEIERDRVVPLEAADRLQAHS
jgi:transcription antitermination factor NusG